ncbi:MAG: tRNA lysidine(34) synthetase TilS [Lentisphaerae bacterium]|nr:tRNA lysidine(34) synthetase TilS [Lentisphaerota bacterium]
MKRNDQSVPQTLRDALGRGLLPAPGARVLLAVSGGSDSTAMLLAFRGLARRRKLDLAAAHLNHRIRGREADADAAWVRALCRRLDIPCVVGRADVPRLARRRTLSLETAARAARYRFLARTARRLGADCVATAHTADDQAETVLLRLARGAGPAGLAGIPRDTVIDPAYAGRGRPVRLIRPLLDLSRASLQAYLERRRAAWREDAGNRDPGPLRNRVRHTVLPLLADTLNPRVREALCRTADLIRAEDDWLNRAAAETLRACAPDPATLDVATLNAQPAALRRRVVRLWLAARGVPADRVGFDLVDRLLRLAAQGRGSRAVPLPGGGAARRRYGALSVDRAAPPGPFRAAVRIPGETRLPGPGLRITAAFGPGAVRSKRGAPGPLPARAALNRTALGRRRLTVRAWKPGDRMRPHGLHGSRKLQDIFTDAKIPADRRARLPVFECAGEIVWVPGGRVAEGWTAPPPPAPALQLTVSAIDPAAPDG